MDACSNRGAETAEGRLCDRRTAAETAIRTSTSPPAGAATTGTDVAAPVKRNGSNVKPIRPLADAARRQWRGDRAMRRQLDG